MHRAPAASDRHAHLGRPGRGAARRRHRRRTAGACPDADRQVPSLARRHVAIGGSTASARSTRRGHVNVAVAISGFDSPLDVTNAGDGSGRLFVVEQAGRIRLVKGGALVERPFLDITGRIASGGERGLLGLAFHPDYPTDPRFFVDYTDRDGNTVVSQFTVSAADPDLGDPDSEVVLMHIAQPFANHNGGAVVFGPDGMLYIATGDGGSGGDPQGNGQRLDTHLGKILRIDVNVAAGSSTAYQVPADNPFATTAGAKPEIWFYGLRNPWRIRFDRDDRRPVDRRRRAERLGGDRCRAGRPEGAGLRLEHHGGDPLLQPRAPVATRQG